MGFIEGIDRTQASLLPACIDDYIAADGLVRIVDAFVDSGGNRSSRLSSC
jgi:transposase